MKQAHQALAGALLALCAGSSAMAARDAPTVDPGIVERPPANVDPKAIERPARKVDPGILEPPGAGSDRGTPGQNGLRAAPPPVTGGGPDLPSIIVVPRRHANDERLGNGCWVQFFDDTAFRGRSITLVGPVDMAKMNIPGGLWVNWSSALVGPGATVTTFDYEQFRNRTAVLRPGQRVPDLRDNKLGLFEDIHSLRIACGAGRKR